MNDICRQAEISTGALYGHFSSKEDLIAGIAERNRSKFAGEVAELAQAPDLIEALSKLGEHYTLEEPRYKQLLCIEIGCEATRNEAVRKIHRSVDKFVLESFTDLFARAKQDGKISPELAPETAAEMVMLLGDGMFWRRAVDPDFNAEELMPAVIGVIDALLNPVRPLSEPASTSGQSDPPLVAGTGPAPDGNNQHHGKAKQ